jgi:hypothetical protein
MGQKNKVRIDAIHHAERALDALPEFSPEEVTKTQAVRMLIARIRATQAKGYSLEAISQVLAERGISIGPSALRAYMSETKREGDGRKRKHRSKRARPAQGVSSAAPSEASPRAAPAPSGASSKQASTIPRAVGSAGATPASPAPAVRRAMFVPREDSDEI